MENLPTLPQVKRNNTWNLRLEVAVNSKGCLTAPVSILKFLSDRMRVEVTQRLRTFTESVGADLNVVDPIVFIIILINMVRPFW